MSLRRFYNPTIASLHSKMVQTTNTNLYIPSFLYILDSKSFVFGTFLLRKMWSDR